MRWGLVVSFLSSCGLGRDRDCDRGHNLGLHVVSEDAVFAAGRPRARSQYQSPMRRRMIRHWIHLQPWGGGIYSKLDRRLATSLRRQHESGLYLWSSCVPGLHYPLHPPPTVPTDHSEHGGP